MFSLGQGAGRCPSKRWDGSSCPKGTFASGFGLGGGESAGISAGVPCTEGNHRIAESFWLEKICKIIESNR